jgi:hypothetical protein
LLLLILTLLSPSASHAEMDARAVLRTAIQQCSERHHVEANIWFSLRVFGDEYTGEGVYREQCPVILTTDGMLRPDRRNTLYRLELNRFKSISSVEPGSAMTITFDGTHVWIARSIDGRRTLQRVVRERLARALDTMHLDMSAMPNLGGLSGLLRQIDRFFVFDGFPVEVITIGARPDEFTAYRIRGRLDETRIQPLLRMLGITENDAVADLPPHVPKEIVMLIGKEDLFPYRLEYFSQVRGRLTPLLELRFENVRYNEDIPFESSRFSYTPGELEFPEDITEDYIDSLRLE